MGHTEGPCVTALVLRGSGTQARGQPARQTAATSIVLRQTSHNCGPIQQLKDRREKDNSALAEARNDTAELSHTY